jgi:hypothetical protein
VKPRDSARFWAALAMLVAARATAAGAPPPIVRVYVAGPPEAVAGSRDAIQDLCSRSNVAVVVRDAAGADEALLATRPASGLAEAYVDLRPDMPPRVVVVDGETRQDLERRTLPVGSSLEVSIETVARVVCSAVESSLAARADAPSAVSVQTQTQAQPAPRLEPGHADRGSDWAPRAAVFGAAENLGAGFHGGAGAALSMSYGRSALRFGALLSFASYAAADVDDGSARAAFGLMSARAMPVLEWLASSDMTAFFGLGGGADWTHVSAESPPSGGTATFAGTKLEAIASGIVGTRLRISRSLSALLALDADLDLDRHNYVIRAATGSRPLFEPARVRPVALAGLSLSFGGPDSDSSPQQSERQ